MQLHQKLSSELHFSVYLDICIAWRYLVASILIAFLPVSPVHGQNSLDSANRKSSALEFVEQLLKEDYSMVVKNFDSTMNAALPADKLRDIMKSLKTQVGSAQQQIGVRTEKSKQYDVVLVTYRFERMILDIKIVYNSARQVAGLFFAPSQSSSDYKLPGYAKPQHYWLATAFPA